MSAAVQIFNFKGHEVRTVTAQDGEPWWIASDVCSVLTIANPRDAVSKLDEDEKDDVGITDAIGRTQQNTIINESGLYSLILKSRKPEAKSFKKWVTSEVLPTLRKTGRYDMGGQQAAPAMEGIVGVLASLCQGQAMMLQAFNDIRTDMKAEMREWRETQDDIASQVANLNSITLTPLRYVPAGYHLIRTFARDSGIDLDSKGRMIEGGRLSEICELHGVEPLLYQKRPGDMAVQVYPSDMCKLWLNDYRRRNPGTAGMMILFPK